MDVLDIPIQVNNPGYTWYLD